ncbi:MAG: ribonuclease III domain-containing protein [Clostridia bacterium]|nr:ribonuclease III domain-containing protein [Clostridia bacterium]
MELFKYKNADPKTLNSLALAFIGDTIFDLLTRGMILAEGNTPVNVMHKKAKAIVNASSQSQMYYAIENILTEEELGVLKRGRNAKSHTSAKNQSITDYRRATGIEALFGYLYLKGEFERIEELYSIGLAARGKNNEKTRQQTQ